MKLGHTREPRSKFLTKPPISYPVRIVHWELNIWLGSKVGNRFELWDRSTRPAVLTRSRPEKWKCWKIEVSTGLNKLRVTGEQRHKQDEGTVKIREPRTRNATVVPRHVITRFINQLPYLEWKSKHKQKLYVVIITWDMAQELHYIETIYTEIYMWCKYFK